MGAPCSSFARDAWYEATGEDLNANYGPISNPTTLKESILEANGGANRSIMNSPNGGDSASFGSFGRGSGTTLSSTGPSINGTKEFSSQPLDSFKGSSSNSSK